MERQQEHRATGWTLPRPRRGRESGGGNAGAPRCCHAGRAKAHFLSHAPSPEPWNLASAGRPSTRRPTPLGLRAWGAVRVLIYSRVLRAHSHGLGSGQVLQPWAAKPHLALHCQAGRASVPEGQHPVTASSRQSARPCPARRPGRRALPAPPPPVNRVAARPPQVGACGGDRDLPAARGRRCSAERLPRNPRQAPGKRPGAASALARRSRR